MAKNIKGLTVVIDGNVTKLSKAIATVNTESKSLQREIKGITTLLNFDPKNVVLLEQKERKLTQAISDQASKRKELQELTKAYANQSGPRTEDEVKDFENLQRELVATEKNLKAAKQALADFNIEQGVAHSTLGKVGAGLEAFGSRVKPVGEKIESLGRGLSMTLTPAIVAAGTASFAVASNFESSMSRVAGALNDPNANMEELSNLALQMGADTIFSATEAGAAMEELAKGGLTAADIQGGALATTMSLAAAGGLDLATAASTVVQSMGAFELSADQTGEAANALAGSAAASSADVADLTQGLSQVSAQAHSAGWSIQDTTAVLGGFADAGIKGSDAGTSLKTMLQRLAAPTEKAADMVASLGINVRDGNGIMLDAAGVAQELQDKLGGLSSAEKDMAMQTIFGSDASRAALVITNLGREGIEKYTEATNDQTAAQRLADSQMGEGQRAIEEMKGAIETAAIKIGTLLSPVIVNVAGVVGDAAEKFANMDEGTQKAVVAAISLSAAIGPVLASFGSGIKRIEGFGAGLQAMAKFFAAIDFKASGAAGALDQYTAVTDESERATKKQTAAVGASSAAMGAARAAAMGLAGVLAGYILQKIVTDIMAYNDAVNTAKGATDGLRDAVAASSADYSSAAGGMVELSTGQTSAAESAQSCLKAQADLAGRIKATAEETGTNAAVVENYTGIIDQLTSKYDENGNKASLNASEQAQLQAAVAGLNEVCGTTYSVIDAASGALNVSTDTLHKNAEAWIKNAKAQAAQEAYIELVKQQIENERELAKTTKELEGASEGWGLWLGDFPALVDPASESYHNLKSKQEELTKASKEDTEAQGYYLDIIRETTPTIDQSAEATSVAAEETAAYSAELEAATTELSAFVGESGAFAAMLESSGMSVGDLASRMQDAGISVDDLKNGIKDYAASAQDAFERIEQKSDISLDQMLANLQENTRITQEWGDNLKILYANAGSGSERAFIDYISSMGVEYAPIVQALVNDTTGKMAELAAAYQSGGAAGANAYLAGISTLPTDAPAAVAGTGEAVVQTIADGANSNLGVLYDANGNITTAGTINPGDVDSSAGGASNVASYAAGQDSAAGTAAASSDAVSKLSADHMSSASVDAWWAGHNITAGSFSSGIDGGRGVAVGAAGTASKHVADHFSSSNGDAWWAGYNMSAGLAQGIYGGRSLAVNAAASIARDAINAAKKEADINSPSREMEVAGEFFTEGWAVGIENNAQLAINAAKNMVGMTIDKVAGSVDSRSDIQNYVSGVRSQIPELKKAMREVSAATAMPFALAEKIRLGTPASAARAKLAAAQSVNTASVSNDNRQSAVTINVSVQGGNEQSVRAIAQEIYTLQQRAERGMRR